MNDNKNILIRYKYDMYPPKYLDYDPSLSTTLKNINSKDLSVFAVTAVIPTFMGWNTKSTLIIFMFNKQTLYLFIYFLFRIL